MVWFNHLQGSRGIVGNSTYQWYDANQQVLANQRHSRAGVGKERNCCVVTMQRSKVMKPGEDTTLVERGVKNRWRWARIKENGGDGKPLGTWCHKLRVAGA